MTTKSLVAATATTETADAPVPLRAVWAESLRRAHARLRFVPASLRTRILAWLVGVVALATLASVLVTYKVLLVRLDHRIDAELTQEAEELRKLAVGKDPETGQLFGPDARRIFQVYFQQNVPSRNEALITFLDGRPFWRSRQVVPYDLSSDPELISRWASIDSPDRGEVHTPAGRVEYLAVPLRESGGRTVGVFVAAVFAEREQTDANAAARAVGVVGIVLLLLGSLLAWRLADRVIRPVSELTETARTISETDLSARIPARGRDQVAELAVTFNEMLDRLELAFGAQRRFVDDAGHELKTPLTIVRGHLELLDDDPEERQASLTLVVDELDRMTRIVEDLLLLARHGQPDFLKLGQVDVATLTDEIHAKAAALAPRAWTLESIGSGSIVADRQRLTQAMMQLADNAVRHGGNREPIVLGSRVGNGEARFWVRDHGPGIAPEDQRAIFERFHRASGPRRSDGAGLGLAIVKAIAEAHDGRVELESLPAQGACFAIVLPWPGPTIVRGEVA